MKKWLISIGLIFATVLIIAGCSGQNENGADGQGQESTTGETKQFTIEATNFEFDLKEIKVNKGDTVKITLKNTQGLHGVEIKGYDVEIGDGKTVSFVADQAGEFDYLCSIFCGEGHADMTGTLIVE